MFLLDSNAWITLFRGKSEPLLLELKRRPASDILLCPVVLTLVTHNTSEFARVPGLALADWQTTSN